MLLKKSIPPEITIPSRQEKKKDIFFLARSYYPFPSTILFPAPPGIFQRLFLSRPLYIMSTHFLSNPVTETLERNKISQTKHHTTDTPHSQPYIRVRVLHIEPFFLPVDTQHTQLSAPILPLREILALWSQNHGTQILHCNAVSRADNAMTSVHTSKIQIIVDSIRPSGTTENHGLAVVPVEHGARGPLPPPTAPHTQPAQQASDEGAHDTAALCTQNGSRW